MEKVLWLLLCIALFVLEACTAGLVCIWFAIGALSAFILSLFGVNWLWCLVSFILVSVITLIVTRKFASKFVNKKPIATNADALIGKPAIVTEEIDNTVATGRVLINGQSWKAKARVGDIIKKGELVEVIAISGVSLVVVTSDDPLGTLSRSIKTDGGN